ncbi:MAG: alpha/beta fold hydrolase, partial [Spirochaetota bacterium]
LVSGAAAVSPRGRSLLQESAALAEQGKWRRIAREQISAFYPGPFGTTVLAGIAWLFPSLYGEPDEPSYYMRLCSIVAEADLRVRSKDVSAKALVIVGERDVIYPPEVARETALLLADGDLVIIPRAGHGVFKSHASRINKLIASTMNT